MELGSGCELGFVLAFVLGVLGVRVEAGVRVGVRLRVGTGLGLGTGLRFGSARALSPEVASVKM